MSDVEQDDTDAASISEALSGTSLRVWAELGRTRMDLGRALELPLGAVVPLDRSTDAPVDIFVNGVRFGAGSLFTNEDGDWAIRIDSLTPQTLGLPAPVQIRG